MDTFNSIINNNIDVNLLTDEEREEAFKRDVIAILKADYENQLKQIALTNSISKTISNEIAERTRLNTLEQERDKQSNTSNTS